MFCNRNESVANFRCKLVAIQLQFTYQTFISTLLQIRYSFAIDLSVAKFPLKIRIFLIVSELEQKRGKMGMREKKAHFFCTVHKRVREEKRE